MKSKISKSAASAEPGADAPAAPANVPNLMTPGPRKCRNFIRQETANAMSEIVKAFIMEAKRGSVQHFNALSKVAGFDQHSAKPLAPKSQRRSLARQLLDEVERYEAKLAEELAVAEAASSPQNNDVDSHGQQETS